MDDLSKERFIKSLDWAMYRIEQDAHCYGYEDDEEYLEFIKPYREYYNSLVKDKYRKDDPREEARARRRYKAVTVKTGKEVIGWPAEAMSGKLYLIVMIDDYNPDFSRIGYVEIKPETMKVIE